MYGTVCTHRSTTMGLYVRIDKLVYGECSCVIVAWHRVYTSVTISMYDVRIDMLV